MKWSETSLSSMTSSELYNSLCFVGFHYSDIHFSKLINAVSAQNEKQCDTFMMSTDTCPAISRWFYCVFQHPHLSSIQIEAELRRNHAEFLELFSYLTQHDETTCSYVIYVMIQLDENPVSIGLFCKFEDHRIKNEMYKQLLFFNVKEVIDIGCIYSCISTCLPNVSRLLGRLPQKHRPLRERLWSRKIKGKEHLKS